MEEMLDMMKTATSEPFQWVLACPHLLDKHRNAEIAMNLGKGTEQLCPSSPLELFARATVNVVAGLYQVASYMYGYPFSDLTSCAEFTLQPRRIHNRGCTPRKDVDAAFCECG